jgi:TPR repeat protein
MRRGTIGERKQARSAGWIGPALCAALVVAITTQVQATTDDDYRAGLQAYQGGDVVGAMKGLRTAADGGHLKAQGLLAFILERSGSPDEALRYYKLAAEQGDADAEVGLAQLSLGRGGSEKEALALLTHAASRGNGVAIETIADAYLKQTLGLTAAARDDKQAVCAIAHAAERDYLPAIDAMATAYRTGQFGLAIDTAEAARWQARADQLRQQRAAAAKRSTTGRK